MDDISAAGVKDCKRPAGGVSGKLLIFGPGEAKGELEKEIKKTKSLAAKVLPLETTDKMTEKQIAAKVRKFFASYS